jgi:putative endonuclease
MGGWVYIMTNRCHGTLYTGVTANLPARSSTSYRYRRRVHQALRIETAGLRGTPREDRGSDLSREDHQAVAARRKIRLIEAANPEWKDLYDTLT